MRTLAIILDRDRIAIDRSGKFISNAETIHALRRPPMTRIRFARLLALAAITSLTFVTSEAFAQQKEGAPPGKGSFVRYCAGCHGADAKGDGPKAATLNPKPAD